jgi:multiple sugar transport system substrate-binding protein
VQETAKDFIAFMTSKTAQSMLKQYGCTIPMLREVAEDNSLLDPDIHPEDYNVFLEVLPYAQTYRDLRLKQSEVELIHKELDLMWANMESPADACRRIETMLNGMRTDPKARKSG